MLKGKKERKNMRLMCCLYYAHFDIFNSKIDLIKSLIIRIYLLLSQTSTYHTNYLRHSYLAIDLPDGNGNENQGLDIYKVLIKYQSRDIEVWCQFYQIIICFGVL